MASFLDSLGSGGSGGGSNAQLGSMAGSTAGGLAGMYYGGPLLGMVGSSVGGMAGGAIGGLFDDDEEAAAAGLNAQFNPYTMSTADVFNQAGSYLPQLAGYELDYNNIIGPGLLDLQMRMAGQFDPSLLPLQREGTALSLARLRDDENLSPALTADVTRELMEANATSGFGASPGGTGNIILQRALARRRIGQENRAEAQRAASLGLQQAQSYFQPRRPFGDTPALHYAGDLRSSNTFAAALEMANQERQAGQDAQQSQQLTQKGAGIMGILNTGGGGSGIGGPNYGIGSESGNQWTSILNMAGGWFGGGSVASQRQRAYNQGGIPTTASQGQTAYDLGGVPMNAYGT